MQKRPKRETAAVKKPIETTEQQIQRQLVEKGHKNQLADIIGKWPGDESFEELLKQLSS